jgi:hypothetical protein
MNHGALFPPNSRIDSKIPAAAYGTVFLLLKTLETNKMVPSATIVATAIVVELSKANDSMLIFGIVI